MVRDRPELAPLGGSNPCFQVGNPFRPFKETVAKAYDYLDLMHGVEAFVDA